MLKRNLVQLSLRFFSLATQMNVINLQFLRKKDYLIYVLKRSKAEIV